MACKAPTPPPSRMTGPEHMYQRRRDEEREPLIDITKTWAWRVSTITLVAMWAFIAYLAWDTLR